MAPRHTEIDSVAEYYIHQGGGIGSDHLDDLFGPVYVGSPYSEDMAPEVSSPSYFAL